MADLQAACACASLMRLRFSPEVMRIYDRILEHAKTCPTCAQLAKDSPEPAYTLHRLGCLTGVLLTELPERCDRLTLNWLLLDARRGKGTGRA